MTQKMTTSGEPVRLLFEMTRDDNPRLYDDLIRFNKGTKRVNRLRFLAHEGLLAQTSQADAVRAQLIERDRVGCPTHEPRIQRAIRR